jgi:hypothetical protein
LSIVFSSYRNKTSLGVIFFKAQSSHPLEKGISHIKHNNKFQLYVYFVWGYENSNTTLSASSLLETKTKSSLRVDKALLFTNLQKARYSVYFIKHIFCFALLNNNKVLKCFIPL